jgi:PAS domain S-box-containing protein
MRKLQTWAAGFVAAVGLLAAVTAVNLRIAHVAAESEHEVARSHQIRTEMRELFSALQDVETGSRGFVLGGTTDFLEPYTHGLDAVAAQLDTLRALLLEPDQQEALAALEPLITRRIDDARELVRTREEEGFDAAQRLVASGQGKTSMDAVRTHMARMDNSERRLLDAQAEAHAAERALQGTTLAGATLSLLMLVGVFALVVRESRLRTRTLQDLGKSEASLAITLQSIGDGVLATDADGRITRLNAVAERLTGWTQAEAAGRPVAEVFHIVNEETRQPAFLPVSDTLASGTIHGLANHTVLIARDGSECPIADSCAPIRDHHNHVVGAVLVFRDVTEEQRAALTLRESARQLRAALDANTLIMRHSLDVICTIDADGRFAFVSDASAAVWGYAPDELVGRAYMDLVHPDDHALTQTAAATIMGGEPLRDFANRYRRKDGSVVPILWTATWSPEEQLMFCIARDITEREVAHTALKRAHEEVRRANAQLGMASRHKDEFLANMSHELRTPLNAILGLSEALLERLSGPLTPRQEKAITTIAASGTHLLELINDILDLSKVEAGKLDLFVEPLEVRTFCQSCLSFIRSQAMEKDITVAFDDADAPATVSADPKRLKQILVNLLTNAVKFTEPGGRIGLRVHTVPETGAACFVVWDTGVGIAHDDQHKLFQSFSQIDSGLSRSQDGTGLGLALVARLTELHGGSVSVNSAPGQGSEFTVTLPLAQASSDTAAPRPDRNHVNTALLIEDDPLAGEQLVRYLEELGIRSRVHTSGDLAVDEVLREPPDVILLDLQLPGESGWVVLERLQAHPETKHIPVVVVSVVDERAQSLALGAVEHFTKPLTRAQLAEFFQRSIASGARARTSAQPSSGPRQPVVLLAEDNAANVVTVGGYLEDHGYIVHYATNGVEAVSQTRHERPDVILMDIQMPVMDGLTAIREIRQDDSVRHIPIVALTALAMTGDRERCLAAGATEYMTKPVSLKALTALVAQLTTHTREGLS